MSTLYLKLLKATGAFPQSLTCLSRRTWLKRAGGGTTVRGQAVVDRRFGNKFCEWQF